MNIIERRLEHGSNHNHPAMIVVHAMGEYVNDGKPMLATDFLDKYGLSAHAIIMPNGDVMVCRHETEGAYHAKGFNSDSLGVEFAVKGVHDYGSFLDTIKTDWVTHEQWISGIALVRDWMHNWNIDKNNVKRHSDISPGRKVDPGTGFRWNEFLTKL